MKQSYEDDKTQERDDDRLDIKKIRASDNCLPASILATSVPTAAYKACIECALSVLSRKKASSGFHKQHTQESNHSFAFSRDLVEILLSRRLPSRIATKALDQFVQFNSP